MGAASSDSSSVSSPSIHIHIRIHIQHSHFIRIRIRSHIDTHPHLRPPLACAPAPARSAMAAPRAPASSSRKPAAHPEQEPDEVIGDFRRGREIGKGSFAAVYLAQHRVRWSPPSLARPSSGPFLRLSFVPPFLSFPPPSWYAPAGPGAVWAPPRRVASRSPPMGGGATILCHSHGPVGGDDKMAMC